MQIGNVPPDMSPAGAASPLPSLSRRVIRKMRRPNTRIEYRYVDAGGNKKYHHVVVAGHIQLSDVARFLHDSQFFIPSQVGLEDLQHRWKRWDVELDHVWHEFVEFMPTTRGPRASVTAAELIANFQKVCWDEAAAMKTLGMAVV